MARFRICKTFCVESGHMLSRHPESCRFPHGHSRTVEVVVSAESLDECGMVLDFKALSMAVKGYVERYDHAMAVNSMDPALEPLRKLYPEQALVVFEDREPTTEAMAEDIYRFVEKCLAEGFASGPYRIAPGRATLDRVRVWETPSSWAEYGM
jgi:6-pyruvoyltetrahydropterin/6-carboxytetrahydropterin synthase